MRLMLFGLLLCAAADARLLRQTSTTAQPLSIYTGLRWNLKDAEVTCPAWNGTEFVSDASTHTASIARVPPDQAKLDAYVAKLCAESTRAGAALDSDLLGGGPTAQLAFQATLQSCTSTAPLLAHQWFASYNPNQAGDFDRVLKCASAVLAAVLGWEAPCHSMRRLTGFCTQQSPTCSTGTAPTHPCRPMPSCKSLHAWVIAGDAQGVPACAAAVATDKFGDTVELRQLFVGSSNMATSPAGANCTGGSSGGGIVPTPAVSPILPSISPTVPPISPTPTTPGGGGGLAPANPSNTILSSVRMNVKAVSCPMWNGTAFGTDTKYWAASAKPAAIDWDKAMELVNKLCASPALAGPTLLAAFEKPGTAEANTSVAASIQSCPGSGDTTWLGWLYIKTANPQDDHSDGSQAVSYAQKWVAAADAAGYALCVAVGQFDPSWALVGALHLVHNPTPWSGSNKPGFSGVFNAWVLPHPDVPGQPAACKAWNGTAFVPRGAKWKGAVANPASVDQTQFKAYVSAICGNEATAGATLATAIKAGSPTAQMAAYTMLYKCTDNSTIGLSQAAWDAASPFTSMDTQGAVSFAKAWRDALDAIDYPLCVTVTFWENGAMLNQTQVHPFGEKAVGHGSGDGGISPPVITSPVIIPPAITFNRSA